MAADLETELCPTCGWQHSDEAGHGKPRAHYCYDPDEWESTYSWEDKDELATELLTYYPPDDGYVRVSTLVSGPDIFAVKGSDRYHWFASEDAARRYALVARASEDGTDA